MRTYFQFLSMMLLMAAGASAQTQTPAVTGVSPATGSVATQLFTVTVADGDGAADIAIVNLLINDALDGRAACYLAYQRVSPTTGTLYLVDDAGDAGKGLLGMAFPGTGTVQNSQCAISGTGSSVSESGSTLTLNLNITFKPKFGGNRLLYAAVRDAARNSGWKARGAWEVPPGKAMDPVVVSMTPGRGTTNKGLYTFSFQDPTGIANLGVVNILVNDFLDGRSACYLAYTVADKRLFIVEDTASGGPLIGPGSLGVRDFLSNSQCMVNLETSSETRTATNLDLKLDLTFSDKLAGDRVVYMAARNANGVRNSGWQGKGTIGFSAGAAGGFTTQISSVTPTSASPGQSLSLAVTSVGTPFVANSVNASLGPQVTVGTVTVNSPTSLTIPITVAGAAALGARTLTVTQGGRSYQLANALDIVAAGGPPVSLISAVTPNSGYVGGTASVSITGVNTNFSQGNTTVSFGADITVSNVVVTSATGLTAQLSIGANATPGYRTLTITRGTEILTYANAFTITAVSIFSVLPSSLQTNTTNTITIVGTGTAFVQGAVQPSFGPGIAVNTVKVRDAKTIDVEVSVAATAAPGPRSTTLAITGKPSLQVPGTPIITGPSLVIAEPVNGSTVSTSSITVRGGVGDPAAIVEVNGVRAPVSNGQYTVGIPLQEGFNSITVNATAAGGASSAAVVRVNLDTTPPKVTVLSPAEGQQTSEDRISVTGLVNDIVVGTVNEAEAQVTVGGVIASVVNRSFSAKDIPLAIGANRIPIRATDKAGNSVTGTLIVTRVIAQPVQIKLVSGNNQSGAILSKLTSPLTVKVLNSFDQPLPNQKVIFRVTGNDGSLSTLTGTEGLTNLEVTSGSDGTAQASWTLGSRNGVGFNRVEAFATGVSAPAVFTANGTLEAPVLLLADSGMNQVAAAGEKLALPFVAIITDKGYNRLSGVPVVFAVTAGGGAIDGQKQVTRTTDRDGRVSVYLELGTTPGVDNNIVTVTVASTPQITTSFSATALSVSPTAATYVSGTVLDNSNRPISGVTMRLLKAYNAGTGNLPITVVQPATTNAAGMFLIPNAPAGQYKLMADGASVPGVIKYPSLEFDITVVKGQTNKLPTPVYLPALSTNRLCVDAKTGGVLTLPESPGFSLTIAPGSATFPGGSKSGCVSVTPVNIDKVPMSPGFGQQPRFVVTIQPVGTAFNPPAAITIPNVDGMKPRQITEMYSYDHDLSSFVAIGTGTVTDDGSLIQSDPGVGVIKAGWHCGGNPQVPGNAGTCPQCRECQGNRCAPSPQGTACDDKDFCTSCDGKAPGGDCCVGGRCKGVPLGSTEVGSVSNSIDFADIAGVVEKASRFSPCTINPILKIDGAVKEVVGCCNNPRGTFSAYEAELSGTIGAGASCFYGYGIPNPFSGGYLARSGITFDAQLTASVKTSGRLLKPASVCKDCNLSSAINVGLNVTAGVITEVEGLASVQCTLGGDALAVTGSYDHCSGKGSGLSGCFGPLLLKCAAQIDVFGGITTTIEAEIIGKGCL